MNLDKLKASLLAHEGFKSAPYTDSEGYITIGIGRNISSNPLTIDEAWLLSKPFMDDAIEHAPLLIHNWDTIGDARQNVLIELVFAMGLPKVLKFQQMRAAVDAGDWAKASSELLDSKWAQQVHGRANDLAKQLALGTFA